MGWIVAALIVVFAIVILKELYATGHALLQTCRIMNLSTKGSITEIAKRIEREILYLKEHDKIEIIFKN